MARICPGNVSIQEAVLTLGTNVIQYSVLVFTSMIYLFYLSLTIERIGNFKGVGASKAQEIPEGWMAKCLN